MTVPAAFDRADSGSPPRVRGHVENPSVGGRNLRITPAGAGTCRHGLLSMPRCRDHPRGCGDMCRQVRSESVPEGSPPRVRGHAILGPSVVPSQGITPAGAGTWLVHDETNWQKWDHPRGCGDMEDRSEGRLRAVGSPPRVRGHAIAVNLDSGSPGITPAGAGTCRKQSRTR